ncbi:putative outer membrane protein [Robiginitalea biformata HTCC2501]|uniref:Putative outer membrane protein n=2 Tax=Robiginitalea TaxID=252306 RepID=A4CJ85_ROBBH|nr:putative outer membrane protein [Robiginitalea biformata HTCC2501]
MVKRLVLAIIGIAMYSASAQNGTLSPYSSLGIGDFRSVNSIENQMMGGLGVYTDSIHLQLNNPASLGKLGLTAYAAGFSHKEVRLETFAEQQRPSVSNFEYLGLAFPLIAQKAGVALGIKPYSSVGYDLEQLQTVQGVTTANQFTGEGGINQAFLSAGFRLLPRLNIGATVNFHFGRIDLTRVQVTDGIAYGTLDSRTSDISGFDFNYGLTWEPMVSSKHTLFTSVRINTQTNLVSSNRQRISSFVPLTGIEIEGIDVNLDRDNLRFTEIKIPTTYTLGLGYGEDKHWFVGAEYGIQQFSDFENRFLESANVVYENASSLALGGFYVPDYTSIDTYLNRVTYRAGLRLDNTGMVINDKALENFGITFGLGLPLGAESEFSNLNLGFELGRRGTTMNGLVRESYFKVSLGLSFADRWFRKRQIN